MNSRIHLTFGMPTRTPIFSNCSQAGGLSGDERLRLRQLERRLALAAAAAAAGGGHSSTRQRERHAGARAYRAENKKMRRVLAGMGAVSLAAKAGGHDYAFTYRYL
jgi:hypothetical protein